MSFETTLKNIITSGKEDDPIADIHCMPTKFQYAVGHSNSRESLADSWVRYNTK